MKKITILIFFISCFLLVSCGSNNNTKIKISQKTQNEINSGNYQEVIKEYEELLKKEPKNNNLKTFLASQYLSYGNYFYKEQQYSKKALELLNNQKETFDNLYYKGYSFEIIRNYQEALTNYQKALELKNITSEQKSIILNQIGHLYDLQGRLDLAGKNYIEAFGIDNTNYFASANIGRYLIRVDKIKEGYEYFHYSLNTNNKPLKSELYVALGQLELNNNNIDKAIKFGNLSIESYDKYPMGYLLLAKSYYMLNDITYNEKIEKLLNKVISINQNSYEVYMYYGLYLYTEKGDYNNSLNLIQKSIETIKFDPILMDGVKKSKSSDMLNLAKSIIFLEKLKKENLITSQKYKNIFLTTESFKYFNEIQKNRVGGLVKIFEKK